MLEDFVVDDTRPEEHLVLGLQPDAPSGTAARWEPAATEATHPGVVWIQSNRDRLPDGQQEVFCFPDVGTNDAENPTGPMDLLSITLIARVKASRGPRSCNVQQRHEVKLSSLVGSGAK